MAPSQGGAAQDLPTEGLRLLEEEDTAQGRAARGWGHYPACKIQGIVLEIAAAGGLACHGPWRITLRATVGGV